MPRHAFTNQHLKGLMGQTRESLGVVVSALVEGGMQQQQIAQSAGWTPPYLSQFLTKGPGESGERLPSPAKLSKLIRALHLLVSSQPAPAERLERELRSVAERYDISLKAMTEPFAVIDMDAPNFVDRADIAAFIDNYVARPAAYAFDGAPMVGLTTTLLQAQRALQAHGYEVLSINIQEELVAPGFIAESQTGFAGALAARMRSDRGLLSQDFFAVEGAIRDHLRSFPQGFALVLDDLDALDVDAGHLAASMMQNWKTRRARLEEGFAKTTVWAAFTANVENARERSWFTPNEIKVVNWFDEEEVNGLAGVLAPRALAIGAPLDWQAKVTKQAWASFGGQPQLTHHFLWDRSLDGRVSSADGGPSGSYVAHLDKVVHQMMDLLGEDKAQEALGLLRSEEAIPPLYADLVIMRLRLAKSSGVKWEPSYYSQHLQARLDHRLNRIARRGLTGS